MAGPLGAPAGSAGPTAGQRCADASVSVIRGVGHIRSSLSSRVPGSRAPSASALAVRGVAPQPVREPHIRSKGTYAASGPDPDREIVQNQPNQSPRISIATDSVLDPGAGVIRPGNSLRA